MKFPNLTNAFGTISAISGTITAALVKLGCVEGAADFSSTCSIPWLPAQYSAYVAILFGVLTFAGKLMRPGGVLHSLFGGTAVIVPENSPKSTVGTVTPAQVAAP
ncbi:MAG: hypothetical protein RIS45_1023 [Planctomycetota bacterium]|jgi:hypothetical protein